MRERFGGISAVRDETRRSLAREPVFKACCATARTGCALDGSASSPQMTIDAGLSGWSLGPFTFLRLDGLVQILDVRHPARRQA